MANVPISNLTTTWNAAGTTFTGLKLNVTDTASAAASLLADFQVGGVSQFSFDKSGNLATGGGIANKGNITIPRDSFFKWLGNNTTLKADSNLLGGAILIGVNSSDSWGAIHSGGFRTPAVNSFSWSSTSNSYGNPDLFIQRDAANTLAQRNSTSAQTFRLYRSYTDGSNFSFTAAKQDATAGYILDSANLGTGSEPTNLLDCQLNGVSKFKVDKNGNATVVTLTTGGGVSLISGGNLSVAGSIVFANGFSALSGGSVDAIWSQYSTSTGNMVLQPAAGKVVEQRNSTSAQTFRLYNTYTDASNYTRLSVGFAAGNCSIKPENAGTGSAANLLISGLPTSNPGPGILWNNLGIVNVGT